MQLYPNDASAHIFLGLSHQELKQKRRAEKEFREALVLEPNNLEALQSLGLLLLSEHKDKEALVYLEKHLQLNPTDETSLDVFIPKLIRMDRIDEAGKFLVNAWECSRDPRFAVRYARFLLSVQRAGEARQFLLQVVTEEKQPRLFAELALTQVIENRYLEAVETLKQAIALRPEYDRAWRGLAQCYTKLGKGDEAIEAAEHALSINQKHYRNWQAKGDALSLLERYEEALEAAQTGIDLIDKNDGEALPVLEVLYQQRFNAALKLGKVDVALAELDEARKVFPGNSALYHYPVQILTELGSFEEARLLIDMAFDNGLEKDHLLLAYYFRILHLLNRPEEAEDILQTRQLEKQPELMDNLVSQAVQLYEEGDPRTALVMFNQLLSLSPDDPGLLNAVSFISIGEGDLETAEQSLNRSLNIEDSDYRGISLNNLGYLYILKDRLDEVESAFRSALILDDMDAFLRVAYFHDGKLVPEYTPHPTRSLTTHTAAQANLCTLSLMVGEIKSASSLVDQIIDTHPDESIGYEVLGCVRLFEGDIDNAINAWENALNYANYEEEREFLMAWIGAAMLGRRS